MKLNGKITKILANFYYVQDSENKTWECFARSRLLKEGKILFVGDELEIETTGKNQGVIVDLRKRRNKITKPPVANINQVLIVLSTCAPDFDFYNLDRYLSFIRYELPKEEINICVNKIDLKKININEVYVESGYKIFYVSALTKEGLDKLTPVLAKKTTVLAGPSGVGKSSLIKALAPEIDIKIGPTSAINSGKHITRNVQLIGVDCNQEVGFLVDTPGFTQLDFAGLDAYGLLNTFGELENTGCNFHDCLHNGEEGCKIQDLINSKSISGSRFKSYLSILEELKSEVVYGKKQETKIKSVGGKKDKRKFLPKIDEIIRKESRKKQKQELLKLEDDERS